MSDELIGELLSRWVQFHPIFAKIGGSATAGIFLSQAYYWSSRTSDPARWFYKTQKEWEQETTLTRYEQESARRQLREKGVLQEKLEGVPAKLYYRLNVGELRSKMEVVAKLNALSMRENHILECGEPANKIAALPQTPIYTESTTDIPELKNSGTDLGELFTFPKPVEKEAILAETPKRRGRPPKPTDPRHSQFIDAFCEAHFERVGERYFVKAQDGAMLKKLLTHTDKPVGELMEIVKWCWYRENEDKFCPKDIKVSEIWHLAAKWNTIIKEAVIK
jgi:hypothetical protein